MEKRLMTGNSNFKNFLLFLICAIHFSIVSCTENGKEQSHENTAYLKLDSTILCLEVVETDLEVPWDLDASREGELWFTQQKGVVSRLYLNSGRVKKMLIIPDVLYKKSYGLLGMAIHPTKPLAFFHYTFKSNKDSSNIETILSKVVRYDIESDSLIYPVVILDSIPGNTYHNGSRLLISSNDKLFLSMGDAGAPEKAQDSTYLNGKILRMNLDGTIPESNPYPNSLIWTIGHRNPQGLTVGLNGTLYSSEHGPNNDDEINIIQRGKNYGWPDVMGLCDTDEEQVFCITHSITEPIYVWTPTSAPSGMGYYNHTGIPEWKNSLLLANLKGRALRVLHLSGTGKNIESEHIFLQKKLGRIRDISVSQTGEIFLSTSNLDWHPRFQPWMYDSLPSGPDRIYKLRPLKKNEVRDKSLITFTEDKTSIKLESENWNPDMEEEIRKGANLYMKHCLSCHGPNGQGSAEMTPPLANTEWVTGDKGRLIRTVLTGLSDPITVSNVQYNQEMPSFRNLTDQELADLLSYVRNSFGNNVPGVFEADIFEERRTSE